LDLSNAQTKIQNKEDRKNIIQNFFDARANFLEAKEEYRNSYFRFSPLELANLIVTKHD